MLKKTFKLVKTIQQRKQKTYMVPRSVLEFNHPDEVFNKFYDAIKSGHEEATYGHTP